MWTLSTAGRLAVKRPLGGVEGGGDPAPPRRPRASGRRGGDQPLPGELIPRESPPRPRHTLDCRSGPTQRHRQILTRIPRDSTPRRRRCLILVTEPAPEYASRRGESAPRPAWAPQQHPSQWPSLTGGGTSSTTVSLVPWGAVGWLLRPTPPTPRPPSNGERLPPKARARRGRRVGPDCQGHLPQHPRLVPDATEARSPAWWRRRARRNLMAPRSPRASLAARPREAGCRQSRRRCEGEAAPARGSPWHGRCPQERPTSRRG